MNYVGPGRYRHYKGHHYEVVGLAIREESKNDPVVVVVYKPLDEGGMLDTLPEIDFWTRKLDDFNEMVRDPDVSPEDDVHPDNKLIPRFVKVDDYEF